MSDCSSDIRADNVRRIALTYNEYTLVLAGLNVLRERVRGFAIAAYNENRTVHYESERKRVNSIDALRDKLAKTKEDCHA